MTDPITERLARRIAGLEAQVKGGQLTQQVARTVIGGVPVEDGLVQAAAAAVRVDYLGDDVARLDDGSGLNAWDVAQRVPVAEDYIEDLAQRADDARDVLDSVDVWRGERDEATEFDGVERAGLQADVEQAGRDIEETRVELTEKLDELDDDLTAADGRITAAKDRADDAFGKAEEAETTAGEAGTKAQNALTMAGSKTQVLYSTDPPTSVGLTTQVWRRQDATTKDILQEWQGTGTGWAETKVSSTAIANLDVGKLTLGTGIISDLVAQHIAGRTATFQTVNASNIFVTGTAAIQAAVVEKLWADVVKAKFLTVTEKIIANDIFAAGVVGAAALSATAIDGKLITGSKIRTAATGQRWEIDAQGIVGFDSTNQRVVSLNPGVFGLTLTRAGSTFAAQLSDSGLRFSGGAGITFPHAFYNGAGLTVRTPTDSVATTEASAAIEPGKAEVTANRKDGTANKVGVYISATPDKTAVKFMDQREIGGGMSDLATPIELSMDANRKGMIAAHKFLAYEEIELLSGAKLSGQNIFALKSQLTAWDAPEGTHAWVAVEGREYMRAGGGWRALADAAKDTDWANVTIPGGTGTCRWKQLAGLIHFEFDITYTSAVAAGGSLAPGWTLPAAARPAVNSVINIIGHGSREAHAYVEASTGNSAIRNASTVAVSRFYGSGIWIAI